MLRLPTFRYLQPRTLSEALKMKSDAGPGGMFVAGGTDLYPNMKRRHQEPRTVISLMAIPELKQSSDQAIGPCVTLTELAVRPSGRPAVIRSPSPYRRSNSTPNRHRGHCHSPDT